MLAWAQKRAGIDVEGLSEKLNTTPDRVASWISGDDLPTFKQAQRIATALRIPFGYLYLPEPPAEQVPTAEFRRLPGIKQKLNGDLYDLLNDIEFKRDWYREYRLEEGFEPLDFVSRFEIDAPAHLVANDIRHELSRLSNSLFSTRKTHERFLDELLKAAEKIGIWIMRSGVISNNTHRSIPVKLLRGFAIADKVIPLIFINGQDAKAAQIFTLAHELAHLWIGKSSIEIGDLSDLTHDGDRKVEEKCNEIAAEFLVPSSEFVEFWDRDVELAYQVDALAERFSVSRIVIARRALEQSLIDAAVYRDFFSGERARWTALAKQRPSGGSYYNNIPARNGRVFTKAVTREAAIGRLLYREAGQLLNIQPSKVREIFERGSA
ncbi:MAG: XRE family transcriptional regulator [Pseudomonadota bacterium]